MRELKKLGRLISANRVRLYGGNARLIAVYQREDSQEKFGFSLPTETGDITYFPLDGISELSSMLSIDAIPEIPFPAGITSMYPQELPDEINASLFSENQRIGLKIVAPIYHDAEKTGVLLAEMFFTQDWRPER